MKILWINDKVSFSGGAETYIYQCAQVLSKKYQVENILLYDVESRVDYNYSKAFSFTTVLADLKQQLKYISPDVIYVHQVANTKILEELSKLEIPVVSFIHDHKNFCLREHKYTTITHETCTKKIGLDCYSCLGFLNKKDGFPYVTLNNVTSLLSVQNILKSFSLTVVASEYMKNHLLLHQFEAKQIAKIPLFSQPIKSMVYSNALQKVKGFLFVGQLVRGKGVDTLLESFAKLNDGSTRLDICGDGKQRAELEAQAKKLGIMHKVSFHGKISSNELSQFYQNAYAVVIPSRAPETFNLVGLEAMKHAKAVLASDVGGIGEWLEDGLTGLLFPSNDIAKLTQVMKKAVQNPQPISRMGQRAFVEFNKKYIPSIHCDALYNQFLDMTSKDFSYAA